MIWNPSNGRFDITLTAISDISDVSIIASWVESQLPPIDPEPPEPVNVETCKETAEIAFREVDTNADGVVSRTELRVMDEDSGDFDFDEIDLNSDGEIEFAEAVQEMCTCDNELYSNFEQLADGGFRVSIEDFGSLEWYNDYNFMIMDVNDDGFVDIDEVEIAALLCETTFDAFDRDGDGVVDGEDAFPEDPNESVDSDGDGVGDNADIAPSIANDLLYATGGMVLLVLAGLLVFFLKGGMGGSGLVTDSSQHWDDERHSAMQDEMLGMNNSYDKDIPLLEGNTAPFGDPINQEMSYNQPMETAETSVETQPSVAQNIAATEASNELLGNQPPQNTNGMSDVLDDLFD